MSHATDGSRLSVALVPLIILLIFAKPVLAQHRKEEEVKHVYNNLIDAEDRHDLAAVRALIWNSSSTLFVAKAPVGWRGYWGIDAVMQHLHDMYQQAFRIEPIYEEEKVVFITPQIAETYAPVRITVAYGGQIPFPKPFVMVLLWVKTEHGWRMTTDIPIPVPPDPAKPQVER